MKKKKQKANSFNAGFNAGWQAIATHIETSARIIFDSRRLKAEPAELLAEVAAKCRCAMCRAKRRAA